MKAWRARSSSGGGNVASSAPTVVSVTTDGTESVYVRFSVPLVSVADPSNLGVNGDDMIAVLSPLPATLVVFQGPGTYSPGQAWMIMNASWQWTFTVPGVVSPTSGTTI